MQEVPWIVGDTETPITATLEQRDETNQLAVVDLTGKTIKFMLVDADDAIVIGETAASIVGDPTDGVAGYTWTAANFTTILTNMGDEMEVYYYGYFRLYDATKPDTFPVRRKVLRIKMQRTNV